MVCGVASCPYHVLHSLYNETVTKVIVVDSYIYIVKVKLHLVCCCSLSPSLHSWEIIWPKRKWVCNHDI